MVTTRTCIYSHMSVCSATMYRTKGYIISHLCKVDKPILDNLKQIPISVVHV